MLKNVGKFYGTISSKNVLGYLIFLSHVIRCYKLGTLLW